MTTAEIIYTVREAIKEYTDDTRYSDEYLMRLINNKRAFFIRREYNNPQRNIDTDVLQTIPMLLEEVDESMAVDLAPVGDLGTTIIRTVKAVPPTIELHNRNVITRVGPVGILDTGFQYVENRRFPYAGTRKFDSNFVFCTLHTDGRIYVKGNEAYYRALEYIAVTALLEDPMDVAEFDANGEVVFDYYNFVYPVEAWMVDLIVQEILKDVVRLKDVPVDDKNDAKADDA